MKELKTIAECIEQIEFCQYTDKLNYHSLENNVAYIKLKKLIGYIKKPDIFIHVDNRLPKQDGIYEVVLFDSRHTRVKFKDNAFRLIGNDARVENVKGWKEKNSCVEDCLDGYKQKGTIVVECGDCVSKEMNKGIQIEEDALNSFKDPALLNVKSKS